MNRLIAVCFLVILTLTVVDALCSLSRASILSNQRQFPRFINRDKRNYVEYNVTYRNFRSNLAIFSTKSTSRFQLWRWFNVNDEAIDELKLIYDSDFYLFRGFFDIKTVHIEIIIDPIECLYTLDSEELENLTRKFLLNEPELMNPKICSAHIYNNGGTGDISMKCCELTTVGTLECTFTNGDNKLLIQHILAICGTVLIVFALIISWNLIDLGSKAFYFYPNYMIIKNKGGPNQNNLPNGAGLENANGQLNANRTQSTTVKISDCIKGLEELKKTFENSNHAKKYKVESIILSVNKRKCIGHGKPCISFLRCLKEPLNDITNCYCLPCEKTCNCCCSRNSRCININTGGVCLFLILLVCGLPLVFLFLHLMDSDSENLCSNYAEMRFKCPFYIESLPQPLLYANAALYCLFLLSFCFYCFGKRYICVSCIEIWKKFKTRKEELKTKRDCIKLIFVIIISPILIGNFFLTMGYGVYFIVYSFIRVFVTCVRTKAAYDELILILLPVLFIFAEKINNVTEKYEAIVEVVLNFINNRNNDEVMQQRQQQQPSAIIFSPNSNNDSTCEIGFLKCCNKLLLKINRPLIFNRPGKPELLSKRFISQLYSKTLNCMECELNHYLKAILFSLLPCSGFVLIFFLFLNFGTTYSYSSELTEYIAITVTILSYFKWFPSKVKGAYLVSGISKDWLEREMTDKLEFYEESWMISDFKLSPLPEDEPQNEHERNFDFTYESKKKKTTSVITSPPQP